MAIKHAMNIFTHILDQIHDLLSLYPKDSLARVTAEPPRDSSHGDISTNAAMVLAKEAGKNPKELAETFKALFKQIDCVAEISVAGPGFINFRLKADFIQKQVSEILLAGIEYGDSTMGIDEKVNVEYVSVNPTGPLHIGHARGSVFGDVLASVLQKAGYEVTREYYVNDAGGQVDVLAKSALIRYNGGDIPAGMYPGEYLIPVAEKMRKELGDKLTEADLPQIKKFVIAEIMKIIRANLESANIRHDIFTSEAEITAEGYVSEALKVLTDNGYIYQGVLEPPKGKKPDDYEEREQTLFKSTDFGDDMDRAIKKSDGSFTYFGGDLGYHLHKIRRGYTKLVNVLGADHAGYVKRVKAGVSALSKGKVDLEVRLVSLVKLLQNGELVKMSKRGGNFIFIEEVIEEVGIDALRFIMLTRKNEMPLEFDLAKVIEQSKDNPVFYVQYAHARAHSAIRQAGKVDFNNANLALLIHEAELGLIRKLIEFPRVVEQAATHYEPHRIAFYLQELAGEFHSLWNLGSGDKTLRFIREDDAELTKARIALVKATTLVIASGLEVMGVSAPEEMR
jgi:arginyl-tRNA synthetase